jgi:probable DNA metabolism protein
MADITLVCDESFDGIMTAIYDGWVLMNRGNKVSIHPGKNYAPTFFSEFIPIETNLEKAIKVTASIRVKISIEAYMLVYRACMHYNKDRADTVFEFLKLGYAVGSRVTKMLGNPHVMHLIELSRKAVNEAHLYKGFIRFDELRGGVLFGKIEPKCDVIPLLTNHFQERFPEEDWIIYDIKRKKAAVHKHNADVIFVEGQDVEVLTQNLQTNDEYRELWKIFFNTIGIDARYNPKCQKTHLPQWYRKHMTEMESNFRV